MSGNTPQTYPLGYTRGEFDRLERQAQLLAPCTSHLLESSGLSEGMRVLDVGCGYGDVTLLAAGLVGRRGQVLGVDMSEVSIRAARERREVGAAGNVEFACLDPSMQALPDRFDAVIGRYVLMWQRDPGAFLRASLRQLKEGGIVAFHELDWGGLRSYPQCSTFEAGGRWIAGALTACGADPFMGRKLRNTYLAAGIAEPETQLHAVMGGCNSAQVRRFVTTYLPESLLTIAIDAGLAGREEVSFATLEGRVLEEIAAADATIIGRSEILAWGRK